MNIESEEKMKEVKRHEESSGKGKEEISWKKELE